MTSQELFTLQRAARDPWHFLITHVRTEDPAQGVAAYPDYDYLREFVRTLHRERFLLVPKSRQMLITWTMVADVLWRALFRGPGLYLLLSRNERCAAELLERTRFIYSQLPAFMKPKLSTNSREEIAFGALGSRILSLPATPHGPRMYSPRGVFWDEMAFTPYDEEIWQALKPALNSGGFFVGVSSSGGAHNLFAKLVKDSGAPESVFHLHRIHYAQHPERTSPAWQHAARRGLSLTRWNQEYEISFESARNLVYDEFDPHTHVLSGEWLANPDHDLYRSIDFGYHHPFVLWFHRLPDGQTIVFDEWAGENQTTEALLTAIRHIDLSHRLTESEIRWSACDPAGAQIADAGISPVDLLRRHGVKLRYRASRVSSGIDLVKAALRDATGRVTLRISPRCTRLIADLRRYQWSAQSDEPVKDGVSDHSLDALRYFFVNLNSPPEELAFMPRAAGTNRLCW